MCDRWTGRKRAHISEMGFSCGWKSSSGYHGGFLPFCACLCLCMIVFVFAWFGLRYPFPKWRACPCSSIRNTPVFTGFSFRLALSWLRSPDEFACTLMNSQYPCFHEAAIREQACCYPTYWFQKKNKYICWIRAAAWSFSLSRKRPIGMAWFLFRKILKF